MKTGNNTGRTPAKKKRKARRKAKKHPQANATTFSGARAKEMSDKAAIARQAKKLALMTRETPDDMLSELRQAAYKVLMKADIEKVLARMLKDDHRAFMDLMKRVLPQMDKVKEEDRGPTEKEILGGCLEALERELEGGAEGPEGEQGVPGEPAAGVWG